MCDGPKDTLRPGTERVAYSDTENAVADIEHKLGLCQT